MVRRIQKEEKRRKRQFSDPEKFEKLKKKFQDSIPSGHIFPDTNIVVRVDSGDLVAGKLVSEFIIPYSVDREFRRKSEIPKWYCKLKVTKENAEGKKQVNQLYRKMMKDNDFVEMWAISKWKDLKKKDKLDIATLDKSNIRDFANKLYKNSEADREIISQAMTMGGCIITDDNDILLFIEQIEDLTMGKLTVRQIP